MSLDTAIGGVQPGSVILAVSDEATRIAATLAAQFTAYHTLFDNECQVFSTFGASRTASWVSQLPTRSTRAERGAEEAKAASDVLSVAWQYGKYLDKKRPSRRGREPLDLSRALARSGKGVGGGGGAGAGGGSDHEATPGEDGSVESTDAQWSGLSVVVGCGPLDAMLQRHMGSPSGGGSSGGGDGGSATNCARCVAVLASEPDASELLRALVALRRHCRAHRGLGFLLCETARPASVLRASHCADAVLVAQGFDDAWPQALPWSPPDPVRAAFHDCVGLLHVTVPARPAHRDSFGVKRSPTRLLVEPLHLRPEESRSQVTHAAAGGIACASTGGRSGSGDGGAGAGLDF